MLAYGVIFVPLSVSHLNKSDIYFLTYIEDLALYARVAAAASAVNLHAKCHRRSDCEMMLPPLAASKRTERGEGVIKQRANLTMAVKKMPPPSRVRPTDDRRRRPRPLAR